MIERTLQDELLTLRLNHGKASALDIELCDALEEQLSAAAVDPLVRAVILTGSGSIFSAGVDLPRLVDGGAEYVQQLVESLDAVLRALFVFPKPAVAAVNGHAIAGGALLTFACDYRIMSAGRIGVPELLVGVPFPALALEMVRFAIPRQHLQSMVYLGRTVEADAAQAMGLIDESVAAAALLDRARTVAGQLADLAPEAFRMTKRQIREPFLRDAAHLAEESAEEIDSLWAAAPTHERIRTYLKKTVKRS